MHNPQEVPNGCHHTPVLLFFHAATIFFTGNVDVMHIAQSPSTSSSSYYTFVTTCAYSLVPLNNNNLIFATEDVIGPAINESGARVAALPVSTCHLVTAHHCVTAQMMVALISLSCQFPVILSPHHLMTVAAFVASAASFLLSHFLFYYVFSCPVIPCPFFPTPFSLAFLLFSGARFHQSPVILSPHIVPSCHVIPYPSFPIASFLFTITVSSCTTLTPGLLCGMPKDVGVSKGVVITYGGRRAHKPTKQRRTTANKSLKQIEKEKQAHAYEISGQ